MQTYKYISILACVSCFLFLYACEKNEVQKSSTNTNLGEKILPRGDCIECPGLTECCCAVWFQDGETLADLRFCGTSNGMDNCSGDETDNCSSFHGGGLDILLNSFNPREPFCINENAPFWIENIATVGIAEIIVTCQGDMTNPDTLHLQIPPGQRLYFSTNGSCELEPCDN